MTISIYRAAVKVVDIVPEGGSSFIQRLFAEDLVRISFSSDTLVDLAIGDEITYRSRVFYLNQLPKIKKLATNLFTYQVTFESYVYDLTKVVVLDSNEATSDITLMGDAGFFLGFLVDNLKRVNSAWAEGTAPSTSSKLLTFSNANCMEALRYVADEFGLEYEFNGYTINLVVAGGADSGLSLEYKAGLRDLERDIVGSENMATVLYGFGSTRNIPSDYKGGLPRLVFQGKTAIFGAAVKNMDLYGRLEKTIIFEDIYPRFVGSVTWVDNTNPAILQSSAIDFDLNAYLMAGVTAKIVFNTGALAGYEFEILYYVHASKRIELKLLQEQDRNLPDVDSRPAIGDDFVLLDIKMPGIEGTTNYIALAEAELEDATEAALENYCYPRVKYTVNPDWPYFKTNAVNLLVGQKVTLVDTDLGVNNLLRIVNLEQSLVNNWEYRLEVSEYLQQQVTRQLVTDVKRLQIIVGAGGLKTGHVGGGAPGQARVSDENVDIQRIGTAALYTERDYKNVFGSAGYVSGGAITDAGSQTFNVATGAGFIRDTNSSGAGLFSFEWAAVTGQAITDGQIKYVFIDYNAGSPQVLVKTSFTNNRHTEFYLGSVVREGTALHILNNPDLVTEGVSLVNERLRHNGFERVEGLLIGDKAGRYITVTAGELYNKLNEFTTPAIDTSGTDRFTTYLGAVLQAAAQATWDNQNYNNAGTLTALIVNRYGVLWFYMEADGGLVMVYGTSNATSVTQAQTEAAPTTLPARITSHGFLIGRLVFQKGASTASQVETVYGNKFTASLGTNHSDLANLAVGDDHSQYAYLAGRAGGQVFKGGTAATDKLVLQATAETQASGSGVQVLGAAAGATQQLFIDYLGNVVIGTGTPTSAVHINRGAGALANGLAFGTGVYGIYPQATNELRVYANSADVIAFRNVTVNEVEVYGQLKVGSIPAGGSDFDKFIVSDAGLLKYRTGAQVLADIAAEPALGNPASDGHVLSSTAAGVRSWIAASAGTSALLSATHTDTLAASPVAGDLIYANTTPAWARLAKGTDGHFLKLVTGFPVWSPAVAVSHNLLSSTHGDVSGSACVAGDLIAGNGSANWQRIAAGTNGHILTMVAGLPAWATPAAPAGHALLGSSHNDVSASAPSAGALIYGNATPAWAKLAAGTDGYYLKMVSGYPAWASLPSAGHNLLSSTHSDVSGSACVAGSIIAANAANLWERLAIGSTGHVLTVVAGLVAWAAPASHNLLSASHGDTLAGTVVAGDLIYGNSTPKWARLAKGTDGHYLKLVSGFPVWSPAIAVAHNLLSSTHSDVAGSACVAGDLIYGNSTPKWARLAKGTNGYILTMVAGYPAWAAAASSNHNLLSATHSDTLAGTVVAGDLIIGNATPKWARLAKGTDGQILTMVSGYPAWAAAPSGGGSPAGSSTEIQYRGGASTFAGNSGFVYNTYSSNPGPHILDGNYLGMGTGTGYSPDCIMYYDGANNYIYLGALSSSYTFLKMYQTAQIEFFVEGTRRLTIANNYLDATGYIYAAGYLKTASYVEIAEQTAPGTPGSGYGRLYFKTDGNLYYKNDAGNERQLSYSTP